MEQHTQKAWMARLLWIIVNHQWIPGVQIVAAWFDTKLLTTRGATPSTSTPRSHWSHQPLLLAWVLEEAKSGEIVDDFGWRLNRSPRGSLASHTIPRVFGTHWDPLARADMGLLLSARRGWQWYEMETGFYLISKGEIFPIVSFPFFSSSTSCSSLLLLLTMAGLPTGLPECRLTRVWKRLTWRNIYKSWKSRL